MSLQYFLVREILNDGGFVRMELRLTQQNEAAQRFLQMDLTAFLVSAKIKLTLD